MPSVSATAIPGRSPSLTARLSGQVLFGTALRALLVRLVGPACSFLMTLLLARSLGAEATGAFYVTLTLVTACAIVAKFGLETALQRFVGAASGRGDLAAVKGIYHQALWISGTLSVLVSTLLLVFAGPISTGLLQDPGYSGLLQAMGLVAVPFSLLGVHAAMLKAVGRPTWGGFFEAGAWPLFTIVLVAATLLHAPLTVVSVALGYLAAALLAVLLGYAVLRRMLPAHVAGTPMASEPLLASCLPLTLVELINYALLWTPFLLLPALADATEAGLYNVSHRLAAQVGLLMIVFASIAAPRFAALHQQGDNAALAGLAGRTTRTMLLFALPPLLALLLFSDAILALFGSEFVAASDALRILLLGQLFNLATGPVGYLLAMTGHERALRNVLLATMAITLPLALLLIPLLGASGAAWAVALPMIFHNVVCCLLAVKRLNLPFFLLLAR